MRLRVALAFAALVACKSPAPPGDSMDTPASPQAKAEPAPLANLPQTAGSNVAAAALGVDGGPPPSPLRADRAVSSDAPAREAVVYELEATLRPSDVTPPPKAPEVSLPGLDAARKKTDALLTIDTSPSRARIVFASKGFVLPEGTELRARVDHYGHLVVAPDGATYRVAAPGALRALLGERRLDVDPIAVADVKPAGDGPKRLGRPTRHYDVTTRAARASFELARVDGAGEGGSLLCRALLDLMSASPDTPLCADGDMPLHADLRWTTRGAILFDVSSITRRADVPPLALAAPPPTASFEPGLPGDGGEVLLSSAELAAFRSGPVDVPSTAAHPAPDPDPALTLVNSTDELRFAFIDGVPAAWVAPGGRVRVAGLLRGRYALQWRTFLSDAFEPPQLVSLPATSDLGGADAGSP